MGNVYFVGVLTGVDNQSNYSYIGMIDAETDTPIFRLTKKSKLSNDAQSVVAFRWFFAHAMTGELPETCEFYHAGKCCRCGRKLTVPESITDGVGPECKGKICKY